MSRPSGPATDAATSVDHHVAQNPTPASPDAAIAEASATVRRLLDEATRGEVRKRYEIGQLLRAIRSARQTYGEHAVERIAASLSIKAHTLYACAAVVDTWELEELRVLSARAGRHGDPLTWSHWVALTSVAEKTPRTQMMDRCLAAGWTVRELRRAITARHHGASKGRNDDVTPGQSVRVALAEGAQDASRAARALRVFTGTLRERVDGEACDEAPLLRTLRALEELRANAEAAVKYVRGLAGSSGRRVEPPSGTHKRVAPPPVAVEEDGGEKGEEERAPERARRGFLQR